MSLDEANALEQRVFQLKADIDAIYQKDKTLQQSMREALLQASSHLGNLTDQTGRIILTLTRAARDSKK